MSALQVYLNWANSVLSDCDPPPTVTVDSIRQGKVLCQIIESFWDSSQDERLPHWDLVPGSSMAIDYIEAALCHLENRNIKVHFTGEDILKGDIKSILDLLWLLILNYNIHDAGTNQYHQCSVGAGRRNLFAWCQNTLAGLQLDKRCSLVKSLCTNDHFLMLLESTPGLKLPAEDLPTKSQHLITLLENIESQFGIKKEILSVPELIAGNIDEQILMIYLALLKWKIENKPTKSSHPHLWKNLPHQSSSDSSSASSSLDQIRCRQIKSQINQSEKQASIVESSEKDGVRQTTKQTASQPSTSECSPAAISISTTTPLSQSMMETQSTSKVHIRTGDSFSLHFDNREASLEDELSYINNSLPYRSPVPTQLYSRSLTPTIASSRQSESRPDYSDFRVSPSLFCRPRSAMGLTNWTDNCNGIEKTAPNMRSSYSTSVIGEADMISNREQREMHLTRYGNLGSGNETSPKQSRMSVNPEIYTSHNVNLSQQEMPPSVKQHGEDGTYSFKKVIITKDGDSAKIKTVPISLEKALSLRSSTTSMPANMNVPFFQQPFTLDKTDLYIQEKTETNVQECLASDRESSQPPPPPLNAPPSSPPFFEMEQFRKMKAASINKRAYNEAVDAQPTKENTLDSTKSSKQIPGRKMITRQACIDLNPSTARQNDSNSAENKMQEIAHQDPDVIVLPNGNSSFDNSNPNLAASSVTSKKIDILCLEIGELKKKVMAMETGRTYLADLNKTFQSTMESDIKQSKPYKEGQHKKESELSKNSKTNSPKHFDLEVDGNSQKNSSLHSLSFHSGFMLSDHPEGISFQKKKTVPSKTSSVSAISSFSRRDVKEHLWRMENNGEDVSIHQPTLPLFEQCVTTTSAPSTSSILVKDSLSQQRQKVDQRVSLDKNEKLKERDRKATSENDFSPNVNDDDDPVKGPSKDMFGLVNGKSEVEELLSKYGSGDNMVLDRMCTIMKELKQENEKLKSSLQQEMVKLQMLSEHLQEVQRLREEDAERVQLEQLVQEGQTLLHQENVELRERLHISEELNDKLKADVVNLQQYKTEIQHTQRNLRERIIRAEKDKKILSEELNLLWRQRKAMRQSNYELGITNIGMSSMEELSTPPKSKASLVEAAFTNRLHQTDKKPRSPLTSSPAGQRLSVAPFPISPVTNNNNNNLENQSPDCLFNKHGLGILYPETPKTHRTVSCLEREKNFFPSQNHSSPNAASPMKRPMHSSVTSDTELDQLLDEVEGHSEISTSIAYGDATAAAADDDDYDDNSDDYDKDVIQLQKRQRLYWSDENLSRHSENYPNGWLAEDPLERNPRSASDLHLSQAVTTTESGRRRMNNVTFNLSNSAGTVPSKQRSTLKGILKKANSSTQYNKDGLSNGPPKWSVSKIPSTRGMHHHSSEDLFLEISQQDFFDPPNMRASNSVKGLLASGMGKRWSSHDSLHSKYSPSMRQRDFNDLDSDQLLKGSSVNPDDIHFSFSDQMSGSKKKQQNQQNKTYPTDSRIIRNHAVFRHLIRDNSMENSPEARPLFGDPDDSRWSFTPYNFYLETLSQQLNEQNKYTGKKKADNVFPSLDDTETTTKEIAATDINTDPQTEDLSIPANSSPGKSDVVLNSSEKSTPAKSGPSTSSAKSGGSQKFSSVLSPEQVEFSPPTEADRNAIVRNLCSVFENSDLSLDGSEPGSAKKSRTLYDLDKSPPTQLTDEQRSYANTLIEKYTRFPTDTHTNLR